MKQADSNKNIKAASKDSPIGAMSITGILKELADNKDSLTNTFQQIFVPNFISYCSVSKSLLTNFSLKQEILLTRIADSLDLFLTNQMNNIGSSSKQAPASSAFVKSLKNDDYSQTILTEIYAVLWQVIDMQQSILTMLTKIYAELPELKPLDNTPTTIKRINQSTKEYIEFLNSIGKLDKIVSKDFVKRFTEFTNQYIKFVDKKYTTLLIAVGVQLTRFTWVLLKLGGALAKTKQVFKSLTFTLILLALAVTMPPFSIAMATLFIITYKLQATFNPKFAFGFTRSVNAVRNALIGMVLAMLIMSKISINDFYKVIGALIAFGVALAFLSRVQGKKGKFGNVTKIDNSCKGDTNISLGLGSLVFGLAFLVIVLAAVKEVNWGPVWILLAFLGAIGLLLFAISKMNCSWGPAIYNKRTQKTGQSLFDGLFKLSLGLAILLLCADAANEVNWVGALYILAFMFGIAMTLFISAKLTGKSRFGGPFQGIFGFAMGVAILLLCADAVKEIDWLTAGKLVLFIAAISMAIHAPEMIMKFKGKSLTGKGGRMSGMFGFAFGLALIILAMAATGEINMKKAFQVVFFIAALVFITNRAKGLGDVKQLKGNIGMLLLMFGATVMVIALASKLINPGPAIIATALSLGTIYAMIKIMCYASSKGKSIRNAGTLIEPIALFLGMGIVAVVAISLWSNPLAGFANALLMFGILYATVWLMERVSKKSKSIINAQKLILPIAGFLAVMIGAVYLISITPLNVEKCILFCIAVAALIGIVYVAGKFKKTLEDGSLIMAIIAGATLIMAFAVQQIMKIQFNMEAALTYVGAVVIMAGICAILGIPGVSEIVAIGALVLLGLAVTLLISALIISLVTQLTFNVENIRNFKESIELISLAFAENFGWIILGMIASVLFLPIAIASLLTAVIVMIISVMPYNMDNINNFGNCVAILANAYGDNFVSIIIGMIAAVLFMPIAIASLLTATLLMLISLIKIKEEQIASFGRAIVKLVDAINELGLWSTIKAVAKAVALIPIATSALLVAVALKAIAALDIDENKIDKFGVIVDKFVTMMCEVVDKNSKKIKDNWFAFIIIRDMANAATSILNVVEQLINMTVCEWDVDKNTHELYIKNKRQVKDEDFDLVSRNMGKIMQALIAPLSVISSNDDEWDFGQGVTVKNPFGKSGFFSAGDMAGVNRIKAIGDAFEKIPAIMQGFCENPLLTDTSEEGTAKMQKLQENIGIFFDTIIQCMNKLPQKSILDTWFDGTAGWLENTVAPVFTTSTEIVKNLSPKVTTMWEYSKTPHILSTISLFWQTTDGMLTYVESAKKKKFDSGFAQKIIGFYNELNKLSTNQWLAANNMEATSTIAMNTKSLVNVLGDSSKFNILNKNLQNTDKNIKSIVGNINKINVTKAGALERNLRLLTQARTQEALRDAIEQLKEMIGMLKEVQEKQVAATQQQTEQQQEQFDYEQSEKENAKLSEEAKSTKLVTVLEQLLSTFKNGIDANVDLSGINEEIVQALDTCGLSHGAKSSGVTYRKLY